MGSEMCIRDRRVNGESVGVSSSGNWHPSVVFDRINEDSSLMMGELVLYPRVLDTAETKMVEGYLAHHWNLAESLPLDHTYKAGLPSGPEGLVLQGTPSSAGTYPVSVTAGNQLGSVSDTFNFTIFAVPPEIQTEGATQVGSTSALPVSYTHLRAHETDS